MTILVTGGAGFIGSNLVDKLVAMGEDVTVFDSYSTGKRENENPEARYYKKDVADLTPDLTGSFRIIGGFKTIFHLAAEARIQPSFEKPFETHRSNVTGTVRVLELARKYGSRVIYAGSSSVYHDPYANPYSFTKFKAEEYCELYNKVYDVPVAIARFFNVYGPRQLTEGAYATVIGIFERQKAAGEPLTITGDGEQRRDFTHVFDIVDGLIAMSVGDRQGDIFNLGTGVNHSINELADLFKHEGGLKYIPERRGEARTTLADIKKSQDLLGWNPKNTLEDYVAEMQVV
jgi:UDP-glucose 4-epimerase